MSLQVQPMAPRRQDDKSTRGGGKPIWARLVLEAIPHPHGKRPHITAQEFAERIGAGPELVRKWVTGDPLPSFRYVQKIREVFPDAAAAADRGTLAPGGPPAAGTKITTQALQEALRRALERRAGTLTGPQVARAARRIDDLAPRLPGQIDEAGADAILDLLILTPDKV